jgi:subtilisin family serine protease
VASAGAGIGVDASRHSAGLHVSRVADNAATGFLAVTYSASATSGSQATTLAAREHATGATVVNQLSFDRLGSVIHILSVPPAQANSIASTLRSQPGVQSVATTGFRRYPTKITTPFFPNDPYFNGFMASQTGGTNTYQILPEESSGVPGQWDMHAIGLEYAFAYHAANSSGVMNAGSIGLATVKIAIIDTGEDPTHPELQTKIATQKCFITNAAGTAQSTSNFETDPLGHGTDVAGIAAADMGNALGFVGAGGNVQIMAYRVFPTPDDNCANENSSDPQCGSSTADIASAINDAVTNGANVISMSLGGGSCTNGTDSDPTEGAAVANAISHNVIVVAASGNSGGLGVTAPACDTGVIAVGATSLADGAGNPNGSGNSLGSPSAPIEYVTSYTQYGSNNTPGSASSWGIVAPGGDPSGIGNTSTDADNLHWIENIWTSTPYQSSGSDNNFTGECTNDYPNSSGTTPPVDCRTLIAGTSMSTPHVAGAAALILSATGGTGSIYQSPAAMKTLLCQTADNLPNSMSIEGCGRLNVYRAMAYALHDPSPP